MIQKQRLKKCLGRVRKIRNGCWEWTGAKSYQKRHIKTVYYGRISKNGKSYPAHRWFYEVYKGEIPKGLEIDHLCRNTLCVNPDHLEAVTHSENMKRGTAHYEIVKRAKLIKECPKGHKYNKSNTYIHKGQRHCKQCVRNRARVYAEKIRRLQGIKTWRERYPKTALAQVEKG